MKEVLTARQPGELTISSNLNRLNQRSIFMPEPAAATPVFTKGDIKEGALRLATRETRTKTGEENRPGAVLAKGVEEKRDPNDPEASLRQLAGQEKFGERQVADIDTKKGREFVENSFALKLDQETGVVNRGDEETQYERVVKERDELESVIKGYDKLTDVQKAPIRNKAARLLRSTKDGEAFLDSLPPDVIGDTLDKVILQSSTELAQVYSEIYGAEPVVDGIDAAQAQVDGLAKKLVDKRRELKGLDDPALAADTAVVGEKAADLAPEKTEELEIPTTEQELALKETQLAGIDRRLEAYYRTLEKIVGSGKDFSKVDEEIQKLEDRKVKTSREVEKGRKGLGADQQTEEQAESPDQKRQRLEVEARGLEKEVLIAQADLEEAIISRAEGINDLVARSKDAIPEAVARRLNTATEQAEQEIRAEIEVMKEKATTDKEKAALDAVEKAITSRYSLKEVVTRRNGSIKKVREVYDRTNMYGDTRLLVEDGDDVYMAAIVKGIDYRTLTSEQREELRSTAKETLATIKPEDLVGLKTAAKEKLMNSLVKADGKLPSGMEGYLLDTPDGQKMIDEVAAKRKEMFKGIKGRVSEYFRTMNRKKALKLLLFMFLPLLVTVPLMATGKFNPFSNGN